MKRAKHILSAALGLALIACLCAVPVSAADYGWQDGYRNVLNTYADKEGSCCDLVDLDLDGTPELLVGGSVGTGLFSVFSRGFTFRDGGTCDFGSRDEYLKLGDSYALYRNDSTGEVRIEGKYVVRAGRGSVAHVTANYLFDGSAIDYVTAFVASEDMGKKTYTVGTQDVSAEAYERAYNSRNDGWTQFDLPTAGAYFAKKPTSAEIDEFFGKYSGAAVLALSGTHALRLNGAPVSAAAYNIGGSNYFKLRDLAALLTDAGAKFEVGYDNATRAITLTTGQSYTAVGGELASGDGLNQLGVPTPSVIYVDGKTVELTGYNIGGSNYFKLRDLGTALGFEVGWDNATSTVSIDA